MDAELSELSAALGEACRARGLLVATAESCTGGWLAQVITHTAGSSGWFERGFVTYANAAKVEMLGVAEQTLAAHGAVSLETAREMASGALAHSHAHLAVAITGIAGPTGGSLDKPVGAVCFAWAARAPDGAIRLLRSERQHFSGDREAIRRQAVIHALQGLIDLAKSMP
ncbi:MAG: nicotinamide-nucleotide amidohydrolase family protein [Rhodocyclaceae bacterium]|nr:nicotinamide-nucleotide amidohydrolase family protein [Rhodocyclaceae bacterium]